MNQFEAAQLTAAGQAIDTAKSACKANVDRTALKAAKRTVDSSCVEADSNEDLRQGQGQDIVRTISFQVFRI